MISNWIIQKELRMQLLTVVGIPVAGYRAWENVSFKPADGTAWIRETLLPGDEHLSANNELEASGIYQVDYFIPLGDPISSAKNIADAIKQAFKPATKLNSVRTEKAQVLPGHRSRSWYQIPIEVHYKTFSTNT